MTVGQASCLSLTSEFLPENFKMETGATPVLRGGDAIVRTKKIRASVGMRPAPNSDSHREQARSGFYYHRAG